MCCAQILVSETGVLAQTRNNQCFDVIHHVFPQRLICPKFNTCSSRPKRLHDLLNKNHNQMWWCIVQLFVTAVTTTRTTVIILLFELEQNTFIFQKVTKKSFLPRSTQNSLTLWHKERISPTNLDGSLSNMTSFLVSFWSPLNSCCTTQKASCFWQTTTF